MKCATRLGSLALSIALLTAPALPCSAFLVVGSGRVLFGNNEDYWDPDTRLWFVPAKEGRRGVLYLGYGNGFPQGGMNDAGLAFDGFATQAFPLTEQEGKRVFAGNPIAEAMETCTTVDEVVDFLEGIDLSKLLANAMLFFADARGDAVIIEGDRFLRKEGDFQAITNFYQSQHEDDLAQCPRYAAAVDVLQGRRETSVALCERALSAAAQRGDVVATLYSNVFDLRERTVRLYLFHDFAQPVVLDLDEELAKGERHLRLPELFPRNEAFERYLGIQSSSVEERIAKRRGPSLAPEVLEARTGSFELEHLGERHRIDVTREGDGLLAAGSVLGSAEGSLYLHSATDTEFFAITSSGELTVRFSVDEAGRAHTMTLVSNGKEYVATAIEAG